MDDLGSDRVLLQCGKFMSRCFFPYAGADACANIWFLSTFIALRDILDGQ